MVNYIKELLGNLKDTTYPGAFILIGEIVKELVSEVKATGNYEVNFNASHLSSGIYFYSLTAQPLNGGESFRSVKKLVLVK